MKPAFNAYNHRYLRLLRMAPFTRRDGAWRFGTRKGLSDDVVGRLLEAGLVERAGDQLALVRKVRP